MRTEEMRRDGNAAAGALGELFARDVTAAMATCAGCGTRHAVGTLLDYDCGMGVVLRCPGCGAVMLRLTHAPGWLRLDASGIALLTIPDDRAVS
jgi:hypothetical protein